MELWGFGEFETLLEQRPNIRNGLVVDTNILIAATYELDNFHEEVVGFTDLLIENKIPLFVNVNIRSEFLEIHRRILFSEVILDFESQIDKKKLPATLASRLTTFRNQFERKNRANPDDPPKRLGEKEIKDFKFEMAQVKSGDGDLWSDLCEKGIGDRLIETWNETQEALGLNTLGLRSEDKIHLIQTPDWDDAVKLMSKHGLASSDAMILNIFLCTNFEGLVSRDLDLGMAVKKEKHPHKICILPDEVKKKIEKV